MSKLKHVVEPGGLSEADKERIHDLSGDGWKAGRIARELRKHPSTVQWFMYRQGLAAPTYGRPTYKRGDRVVRPFSPEEDAAIEAMRIDGQPPTAIARQVSQRFGTARSSHTVACRLVMLAAREVAG